MIDNQKCRWRRLAVAALCAAFAPASATASPLISEVFYDAVGSDNGLSFVELSGAPGASVEGLLLVGINGANGDAGPSVALSGAFGADGLFVVADDAGDGSTQVANADWIANFDFQNGYQTQAKSGGYPVPRRQIGHACASAQTCLCQ